MLTQHQAKHSIPPQLLNFAILGILVLLYGPIMHYWYDGWINKNISTEHEYFSHGIIGFPFAAYLLTQSPQGFGLQGMQERVQMLGGILQIQTAPEKGTILT
ncbi:MAG: archaeosortase/exosortase family protein, partial [Cyanobacteria bacterium P01_A01_bin.68]